MITTNKDFDGFTTHTHPRRYYGKSTDTKPVDNVINGAEYVEVDTNQAFRFDYKTKTWYSAALHN